MAKGLLPASPASRRMTSQVADILRRVGGAKGASTFDEPSAAGVVFFFRREMRLIHRPVRVIAVMAREIPGRFDGVSEVGDCLL